MTDPRDLYGLPLDRFVPERGALVKALRAEGRREEAQRAAALRKPSVAAWTVNQLIRTQGSAVAALFEAGDALALAQSDLLARRGDANTLREAMLGERRALEELTKTARGVLSSQGQEPTRATLDRVSETLHAAALAEDARSRLREGCLDRELRPVGFGSSGAESAAAPPGRGAKKSAKTAPARESRRDPERTRAERAERERAEKAQRERAEALTSAGKAEASAGRRAERAARELRAVQERRERAADSLRDADAALAAARERAEATEIAHQRARATLEDI